MAQSLSLCSCEATWPELAEVAAGVVRKEGRRFLEHPTAEASGPATG